jgi:ubiquitin C-terminal hydrolase
MDSLDDFQIVGQNIRKRAPQNRPTGLKNVGNAGHLNCLVQILRNLNSESQDKIKEFDSELYANIFEEVNVKNLQK